MHRRDHPQGQGITLFRPVQRQPQDRLLLPRYQVRRLFFRYLLHHRLSQSLLEWAIKLQLSPLVCQAPGRSPDGRGRPGYDEGIDLGNGALKDVDCLPSSRKDPMMKTPGAGDISRRHFLAATAVLACGNGLRAAGAPGWSRRAALPLQTQELYPAVHEESPVGCRGHRPARWVPSSSRTAPGPTTREAMTGGQSQTCPRRDTTPPWSAPEKRCSSSVASTAPRAAVWQMLDSVLVLRNGGWETMRQCRSPRRRASSPIAATGSCTWPRASPAAAVANAARADHSGGRRSLALGHARGPLGAGGTHSHAAQQRHGRLDR
jgi:hypothetical protein